LSFLKKSSQKLKGTLSFLKKSSQKLKGTLSFFKKSSLEFLRAFLKKAP